MKSVRDQVYVQVWSRIRNKVDNQVLDQVSNKVYFQVWSRIRNKVDNDNQVLDKVWNKARTKQ